MTSAMPLYTLRAPTFGSWSWLKKVCQVTLICLGLLTPAVALQGCTASQIDALIALAAQLAANALTITSAVEGTPIDAHDTTLITAWQQVLTNTVSSVEANKAAGNSTLLSISEAAETNLPAFLAASQFDNSVLASRIVAGTDSFLTIIESIATLVGQPAAAVTTVTLHSGIVYHIPVRVVVSSQNIVNGWNANACPVVGAPCRAHVPTKTLLHPFSYR
jgi:hypothetical protein